MQHETVLNQEQVAEFTNTEVVTTPIEEKATEESTVEEPSEEKTK